MLGKIAFGGFLIRDQALSVQRSGGFTGIVCALRRTVLQFPVSLVMVILLLSLTDRIDT